MKMNTAQIERTLDKLNTEDLDAQAIPAGHPVMPQLERLFGDHTYFLDRQGLSIVEPLEAAEPDSKLGVIVNLVSWADSTGESLKPHPPELTSLVIDLQTDTRH